MRSAGALEVAYTKARRTPASVSNAVNAPWTTAVKVGCVCRANVPLSLPTSPNTNLNPCPLNYADCIILLFSCAVLTAKVITSEYKDKTLKLISKYRLGKPPVLVQVLTLFCIILYYIVL